MTTDVTNQKLLPSQLVVRIVLGLFTAIALFGGALQLYLGQPDTTPRLDNVHRFMAGLYFGLGFIALWAVIAIRQQSMLIYLFALTAFLGGVGRIISMGQVGLPQPGAVYLGSLIVELVAPVILVVAQRITDRRLAGQ